jgi:hypothetical protein
MAARFAESRSGHHRQGHSEGRIRLADWNALLPSAWTGAAGSAQQPDRRPHRTGFFIAGGEMVLLHGFEKKTQKTPQQDIALAIKRKKEIVE